MTMAGKKGRSGRPKGCTTERRRVTDAQLADALRRTNGQLAKAAKLLGITRIHKLYPRIKKDSMLARLVKIQKSRFTDQQAVQALLAADGRLTVAADMLGVTSSAILMRAKTSRAVAVCLAERKDRNNDLAEGTLFDAMRGRVRGRPTPTGVTAAMFHLECRGRDRGYVKRVAHEGAPGGTANVLIYVPGNGRDGGPAAVVAIQAGGNGDGVLALPPDARGNGGGVEDGGGE
jgi:hypothetical protein